MDIWHKAKLLRNFLINVRYLYSVTAIPESPQRLRASAYKSGKAQVPVL